MLYGKATVLAIGQGCATLLEIWEEYSKQNIFVGLIDCGSDDNKESLNVKKSIETIQTAMDNHINYDHIVPPFLDALIITHQDKDHWDKLDMLFDEVKGARTEATVDAPIQMCIPDVSRISSIVFGDDYQVRYSEEYYAILKKAGGNLLYNGFQEVMKDNVVYSNELELIYEYSLNTDFVPKQITTVSTNVGEVEFSIYINYEPISRLINWEINIDDDFYSFLYSKSIDGKFCLTYQFYKDDEEFIKIIQETDAFNFELVIKESLVFSKAVEKGIDANVVYEIISIYGQFMTMIKPQDIIDTVGKSYSIKQCIGRVFVGGDVNLESPSFQRMKRKLNAISFEGVGSLTDEAGWFPVYGLNDLPLKLLCCRNYSNLGYGPKSAQVGIKRNASGAVILWDYGNQILFPGDATVHTMFYLRENNLLEDAKGSVLIAPHHGSGTTSKDCATEDSWTELNLFLAALAPKAILISSGYQNHHGHPNSSFVQCSIEANTMTRDDVVHNIYYNDKRSGNKEKKYLNNLQTNYEVYTTIMNNPKNRENEVGYAHIVNFLTEYQPIEFTYINTLENIEKVEEVVISAQGDNQFTAKTKPIIDLDKIDFLSYKQRRG